MVARELACKNRLLALLPDEVFARWWPELEDVDLPLGAVNASLLRLRSASFGPHIAGHADCTQCTGWVLTPPHTAPQNNQ